MRNLRNCTILVVTVLVGLLAYGMANHQSTTASSGPNAQMHEHLTEVLNICGDQGTYQYVVDGREMVPELDAVLLREFAKRERCRHDGLIQYTTSYVEARYITLTDFIIEVESGGDHLAYNAGSGAMSLTQFKPASVTTGINRQQNYLTRHRIGPLPVWGRVVREDPKRFFELSKMQQRLVTLANIFECPGSDDLLRRYLLGEDDAAKTLYNECHHTNPDDATNRRVDRLFLRLF